MESSGSAPGSSLTSATSASVSPRLDLQPGARRGQLDRSAQLVAAHRADQDLAGASSSREPRVGGAAAVEVRAERQRRRRFADHGRDGRSTSSVDEGGPLVLVVQAVKTLLELVDDEHHRSPGASGRRRASEPSVQAGRPSSASGCRPAG